MFGKTFYTVSVLFVLLLTGMFVRYLRIINKNFTADLSNLLILVTLPALIFYSTITQFTKGMILDAVFLIVFGVLTCFLGYFIGLILSFLLRLKDGERSTFLILCTFGNTSFLAIPVGFALYGMESVVKIILFDFGCTIVMWTFGIQVISSHHAGNLRGDIIKNMLNPGILALIAGVAVIMTNFVLPGVFMEVCDLLGSITIPMALIATGSFLWEAGTSQWIKWHILIAVVAGKLVCLPLLVILLLFLFELPALMEKIIILQAAMPSMVLSSVLAERYGADSALAASGVFLTTLVSMLTVPLFLSLV